MKKSGLIFTLLVVVLSGFTTPSFAAVATNKTSFSLEEDVSCAKLKTDIAAKKAAIKAITDKPEGAAKSKLDELHDAIAATEKAYQDYVTGSGHGTDVVEETNRRVQAMDDAKSAYYDQLLALKKLSEELLELLKTYQKDCAKNLGAAEQEDLDQDLDDYGDAPKHWEDEAEGFVNQMAEEEASRSGLDTAKKDGESEREYRRRIRNGARRMPWVQPGKTGEEGESADDFKRRQERWRGRNSKLWKKPFWEKLKEKLEALKEKALADSEAREKEKREEGAVPRRQDSRNYYLGGFVGGFNTPVKAAAFATAADLERLLQSMEKNPGLQEAFRELADGGDILIGPFSTPTGFTNVDYRIEKRYGLAAQFAWSPRWEVTLQVQSGQSRATAIFPVTLVRFTSPESKAMSGNYQLEQRLYGVQAGVQYGFVNGLLQGLVGPWVGVQSYHQETTASINTVGWQVAENNNTSLAIGLQAGLRLPLPRRIYSGLNAQWGLEGDHQRYGGSLSLGYLLGN